MLFGTVMKLSAAFMAAAGLSTGGRTNEEGLTLVEGSVPANGLGGYASDNLSPIFSGEPATQTWSTILTLAAVMPALDSISAAMQPRLLRLNGDVTTVTVYAGCGTPSVTVPSMPSVSTTQATSLTPTATLPAGYSTTYTPSSLSEPTSPPPVLTTISTSTSVTGASSSQSSRSTVASTNSTTSGLSTQTTLAGLTIPPTESETAPPTAASTTHHQTSGGSVVSKHPMVSLALILMSTMLVPLALTFLVIA